jgi:hypothetical protein
MADPNIIPFAEGAPADDLMVEELPDGDVLIGDPALDIKDELRDERLWRKPCRRNRHQGIAKKKPQS